MYLYLVIPKLCALIADVGLFFKLRIFKIFVFKISLQSVLYSKDLCGSMLVFLFVPNLVRILLLMDFCSTLLLSVFFHGENNPECIYSNKTQSC